MSEALAEAERSRDLEPLFYFARRYDVAADYAHKTLEIDANWLRGGRAL